jgi:hypothetical protein
MRYVVMNDPDELFSGPPPSPKRIELGERGEVGASASPASPKYFVGPLNEKGFSFRRNTLARAVDRNKSGAVTPKRVREYIEKRVAV